jgi:ATP-dependent protease ClpP protease subunit
VAQLCRRIAEATGRPEEDVGADLDAGRLLSADEAEAYGLVQHSV